MPDAIVHKEAWDTSREATDLIRHAAPLIPRQHLALVLAEIAASVWPLWKKSQPEDWRLAWCLAVLRAWALGDATLGELHRTVEPSEDEWELDDEGTPIPAFTDEYGNAYLDYSDTDLSEDAAPAAAVAVLRAVRAVDDEDPISAAVGAIEAAAFARAAGDYEAANREYEAWSEALGSEDMARSARDDRRPDEDLADGDLAAYVESDELESAAWSRVQGSWRSGFIAALEASSSIIRRAIPWRTTVATDWTIVKDLVLSGDAVLRLTSWAIVDSARREDLNGLAGARAVAFDEDQERAGLVLFQMSD